MVTRVDEISAEEFTACRDRPVLVRGGARDWPALSAWTADYLARTCGEIGIRVGVTARSSAAPWTELPLGSSASQLDSAPVSFGQFLERAAARHEPDGRCWTLQAANVAATLPALMADIRAPDWAAVELARARVWIGPGGTSVRLHYDQSPNIMTQIRGSKTFTVYGPEQTPRLYHCSIEDHARGSYYSLVDVTSPDLERFPLFADAVGEDVVLSEGDMFYLPPFWWHAVTSSGFNVAVNTWWDEPGVDRVQIANFIAELVKMHAALPPHWRRQLTRMSALIDRQRSE